MCPNIQWAFGHLYYCTCWSAGQLRNCQSPVRGGLGVQLGRIRWQRLWQSFTFHCDAALHMLLSQSLLASFKNRCECDTARDEAGIDSRPSDDDDQQVLVHGTQ